MFDPNFLNPDVLAVDTCSESIETPPIPLSSLTSLTPLQHQVSVIYTSSFFHLFEEDKQRHLTHLVASLLSPLPGSIIFGSHMGASDSEDDMSGRTRFTIRGGTAFAHSPTSWKELWVGKDGPFKPEAVSLETVMSEPSRRHILNGPYLFYRHVWSITRV